MTLYKGLFPGPLITSCSSIRTHRNYKLVFQITENGICENVQMYTFNGFKSNLNAKKFRWIHLSQALCTTRIDTVQTLFSGFMPTVWTFRRERVGPRSRAEQLSSTETKECVAQLFGTICGEKKKDKRRKSKARTCYLPGKCNTMVRTWGEMDKDINKFSLILPFLIIITLNYLTFKQRISISSWLFIFPKNLG